MMMDSDAMREYSLKFASDEQIKWVAPVVKTLYKEVDALISLRAFDNSRYMAGVDPRKQQLQALANQELTHIYLNRAAEGDLKWITTQYPCPAYAQEANMSLSDYQDFVHSATYTDKDDPIAEWNRIHDEQQIIVDWLKGKKEVTIKSPNADLSLSVEGRIFINADGKNNIPDGEIYTGPVEDSAKGWVNFTYPAIRKGNEVHGIQLEFKDGKVVNATAERNEEYLLSQLDVDEGARYLGEFAIGTNYGIKQFTKSILYDEKIGGSFHLALGMGIPQTGSKNESAIHWDMICDIRKDSEIKVDGELLYKNGDFQI